MSYVYRLPVTVDDLGPSATPADLKRWEWLHHLEVVGEDRLVSYDYDAVRRRDVYDVDTDNDSVANEIVSELHDRVWQAFCAHDVPPVDVPPVEASPVEAPPIEPAAYPFDLADVRGDGDAWAPVLDAVVECLVTRRPLMLTGSLGSGRVMLARRLVTLLPGMTDAEARDVTQIQASAHLVDADGDVATHRPYRAPHYTVSCRGIVGGGSPWRPGEVDLAAHGVLHLDEPTQFARSVLEATRAALWERWLDDARPSPALLVLTDTLCPCGRPTTCSCAPEKIDRHAQRLADVAALFDAVVARVPDVPQPLTTQSLPSSAVMRARVRQAQARRAVSPVQP